MNIDIDSCLKELKSLISNNINNYKFTIPELRRYIDEINLKGTNELKLKLLENNSYLTMIDFKLVFDEKKIIKKLKSAEYELTSDQTIVLELLGKFFLSSNKIFGLYGYAGTGKTTLAIQIVTNLIKNGYIKKIAIVAPTNKALSVLKTKFSTELEKIIKKLNISLNDTSFDMIIENLKSINIILDFITIHRLLQLKVDYDESGDIIYVNNKKTLINEYELIIVDESSMVTLTMIDLLINTITNGDTNKVNSDTKIIFSGDPVQLPPINEKQSVIFLKNYDELTFHKFKDLINRDKTKNVDEYVDYPIIKKKIEEEEYFGCEK